MAEQDEIGGGWMAVQGLEDGARSRPRCDEWMAVLSEVGGVLYTALCSYRDWRCKSWRHANVYLPFVLVYGSKPSAEALYVGAPSHLSMSLLLHSQQYEL